MYHICTQVIFLTKTRGCSELNSWFDKSELNTRNLANLTPVFFSLKKRWGELNSRIKQANLTPDFWYELNIYRPLTTFLNKKYEIDLN